MPAKAPNLRGPHKTDYVFLENIVIAMNTEFCLIHIRFMEISEYGDAQVRCSLILKIQVTNGSAGRLN